MKNKTGTIMNSITVKPKGKKISRKDAIKKSGLMVLSTATMMILLSHKTNANTSSPAPPGQFPAGM